MLGALLVLALVQGITEFLPISSSGHLVLCRVLLGVREPDATIEIALHAGTLLAILAFYRRRLWSMVRDAAGMRFGREPARRLLLIALASVPAGVVGVALGDRIEALFSEPKLTSAMLVVTGAVLLSTAAAKPRERFRWNALSALFVGFAQAFAILPGVSRSGATISAALWLGAQPEDAAEFSFILAIPAISGAAALKALELLRRGEHLPAEVWVAAAASAIIGMAALAALIPILRRGRFWWFGFYCILVGAIALTAIG